MKHGPSYLSTLMQARSARATIKPPIASDFEGQVFLPLTTRIAITKKNVRITWVRKAWKWNELSYEQLPELFNGHNNGIRDE